MNEKLIKHAWREGFCCLLAYFEANQDVRTGTLGKIARSSGCDVSNRTIRRQRANFLSGNLACSNAKDCVLRRALELHKTRESNP